MKSATYSSQSLSNAALVAGGIALAGTAFSSALWNLFRRRIPYLKQEDLLPDPINDLEVAEELREEDKAGVIEAFSTTPENVWILKDGDKLQEEDTQDMAAITSYIMGFVFFLGENYGHIIRSVDKDGNFQGAIVLMPPISNFRMAAYTLGALATMGNLPSVIRNDPSRKARFYSLLQCETHHHEVMHDCVEDHWYVLTLGVASSAQGKRVGTRLLQQAIHLAGDKPLYLDCHNGNVAYYEKYGFKVGKKYAFEVAEGKSKSPFYFNCMRRDPQ